ncbi:MAG: tRNA (guanosine(37)-N1)-methyltransferase TrmD [Candidatus Nanopelagicaceae bacterium]
MSNLNRFDAITIFPEYFAPLNLSLIGKAQSAGLIEIGIHDLRSQTTDVHGSVDDTPYGGGAGMVMSPEPWGKAIDEVAELAPDEIHELIVLTPAGQKLTQALAQELTQSKHLIFACGRYEGIDVRVSDFYATQKNFKVREISIGDYVLGGGEVATLVIMEAIIRLLPGVIGNPASLDEESHTLISQDGALVEYPNYTKPKEWRGLNVPDVLLSGNHGEIAKWRLEQAIIRTKNRPS